MTDMPNPWQIGHLIQGQYLNSVQEVISDWSDNVLLQATGAAVVVPAATSAPAELLIDGQMRYSNVDKQTVVSGPSGIYEVYATTKRGRFDFDLEATTGTVVAQYARRLGVVGFNGSAITEVTSDVREINVSHIDGHPPEQSSTPNAIPAGRVDATLDPNWLPGLDDARIPLGGIREVWVPTAGLFAIPPEWRLCNGQTVAAADHGWDTPAAVTLPDLVSGHVIGAHPSAPRAQQSDGFGTVAGINAPAMGSNDGRNFQHTHVRAGHAHALDNHAHGLDVHNHAYGQHFHSVASPLTRLNIAVATSVGAPGTVTLSHVQRDVGVGPPSTAGDPTPLTDSSAVAGAPDMNAGANTNGIGGGGVQPAGPTNVSVVPLGVGLAFIMRVRD